MSKIKTVREIILCLALIAALSASIHRFSEYVLPYRDGYGCLWRQFKLESADSLDIMFFGSSMAYCSIIPSVLFDETNLTSYVMAGPQLTIPQTYYYIREAFATQNPKLIAVEITSVFYSEYTDYSRINTSYMPYSINRVMASLFAVEPEERLGALFPPYHYHDLWQECFDPIKKDAKKTYERDPYAGYMFLRETVEQDQNRDRSLTNYSENVYADNIKWLRKIADFATEKDAVLIFYVSPMYKPLPPEYYNMLKRDMPGIAEYIDFEEQKEVISFDKETDFYDIFHMNYKGAYKFTKHIAPIILNAGVTSSGKDTQFWRARSETFLIRAEKAGGLS